LWVKADDLKGKANGDPIDVWPDASGRQHYLKAQGNGRPTFKSNAFGTFPAVVFAGDPKAKVNQFFDVPLQGEWPGVTVFAVGKKLTEPGWLDTAPSRAGCLRTMGFVQHAGTKAFVSEPFPALKDGSATAQVTILCGLDGSGELHLSTFVNGASQQSTKDREAVYGVVFRQAHLGNINNGEKVFNGELAELLIYQGMLAEADRKNTERYLLAKYNLGAADANAPKFPTGISPPSAKPVETLKPPPTEPVRSNLRVWARADDVKGVPDGGPVGRVPDGSGNRRDLTSEGAHRPLFKANALNGKPTLVFEGERVAGEKEPKVNRFLGVPLRGESPETTILIVGRNLNRPGLFDTAPTSNGSLRMAGFLQLAGHSRFGINTPFPLLDRDASPQMIAVTVRKLPGGGQRLTTYANSHEQESVTSEREAKPVLFRGMCLGNINNGEVVFNGEIAEVLIYDRALSDAERAKTETYLAEKYGLTLKAEGKPEKGTNLRSRWALRYKPLSYTMSWLGNTFSGKDVWVQNMVSDSCVLPDGTLAAIHVWDEAGREGGLYKDGKVVGKLEGLHKSEYGHGGVAIATDGKYLYAGCSATDFKSFGIRRFTLKGNLAPWPGFKDTDWLDVGARKERDISGLAAARGELFVAASWDDKVLVYDSVTAKRKRSFAAPQPDRVAVDRDGKVWVSQKDGVVQYDAVGEPTGKRVGGLNVGAIAFDNQNRLLVGDKGDRQQIVIFDVSGKEPREVGTIGEKGGIYTGRRGAMGDNRLLFPNGIGVDAAGNVYVTMSYPGGTDLRSFTAGGQLRWRLYCTDFTDCGNFDPDTDGADIYTGHEHYVHVPGQPPGRDWAWKDCTFDPQRFPDDPRDANNLPGGVTQTTLRRIDGRLYLFGQGDPRYLSISRQEEGSAIFVPCGLLINDDGFNGPWPKAAPRKVRSFWCDRNGRGDIEADEFTTSKDPVPREQMWGWHVDSKGGIWQSLGRYGLRHIPLKGVNEHGVPLYALEDEAIIKRPVPFIEVLRVEYFPETDTMYLAGNTYDHPALGTEHFGCAGREVIRYDDWSKPTRKVRARMPIPDGATNIKAITVTQDGKWLFCGEMETMVLFAYDTETGRLLGIVEPDAALVGGVGWIDIHNGIRAFTRKNGEVLILCEEVLKQKELVYRLAPPKK
jgi:hypothetical protein